MDSFDWQDAVTQALRRYHDLGALGDSPLAQLLAARAEREKITEPQLQAFADGLAVQRLLRRARVALHRREPELADLLHRHYEERISMSELQESLGLSRSALYSQRQKAIEALL
ncbi:MAG: hypothetical protein D6775_10170, partial [Caldilineae bacterium]